jgi:transcriptional regulator with XRE-family HTH domain
MTRMTALGVGGRANGEEPGEYRAVRGQVPFAAVVVGHRRRLGLTQEELAGRSGLSVRGVRDLESGRVRTPRQQTVRLLADAFGLHGADRERFHCLSRENHPPVPTTVPQAPGRPGVPPQPGARFMGWLWATDSTWLLVPD